MIKLRYRNGKLGYRKIHCRLESVSPEKRLEIFKFWLSEQNNDFKTIGEKFGYPYSTIAKIIDIEFGERRKKTA